MIKNSKITTNIYERDQRLSWRAFVLKLTREQTIKKVGAPEMISE